MYVLIDLVVSSETTMDDLDYDHQIQIMGGNPFLSTEAN